MKINTCVLKDSINLGIDDYCCVQMKDRWQQQYIFLGVSGNTVQCCASFDRTKLPISHCPWCSEAIEFEVEGEG